MKVNQPAFPNTVIRASAGTGKTFQLSNRFLQLVFSGAPFDSILATTFTRKAAGEILDRVLLRLAEAALDATKLADLASQIGLATLDASQCRRMLAEMVRHMHRLQVSTLDSFFVQAARNFSLELGLPPGWQIVDEVVDWRLRATAIRNLLQDQSTSDVLRLMHLLTKGQATRSVSEQIAALVKDLYGYYVEAPASAWRSLPRLALLAPAELAAAIAGLQDVALPPHKNFVKAHQQSAQNADDEDWEEFVTKGLAAKILAGETTYCTKPISQEIVDAYRPLIDHVRAVILGQIANQTEATHKLLERFDADYRRLKRAEKSLRFEDVTRSLGEADVADRLDQVLYRLDVPIAHLLLDEFQDTAPLQWRVLRPLAQRCAHGGDGRSFFCVGDVKQAIYGWRGGVAEIFETLDADLAQLAPSQLNQSWRSSPIVVDCVNRLFGGLADNPVMQKHAAAAQKWSERFAMHTTARKDWPGCCTLATAPRAAEGESQPVATLRYAAREIERLHRRLPGRSIGVLVRRNAAVARLIYELRQRHVEASEEGGNPLTDSPAVELVLSLLTLADHPGDTVARFHLAHSPLGKSLGLEDYLDAAAAWQLSLHVRQALLTAGYGPTVYDWTKRLAPACDRRDLSRLLQLVELAYGYEAQAGPRVEDFVALVRQQRVQDPIAADVRVMSIHQAKGLQFDVVVLPELDVGMTGQTPQLVVGRSKPTEPIERVCRYVPKGLRWVLPAGFERMFDAHGRQVVEESLCVLYVAMTRAIHAMHMIVAPSKDNERSLPSAYAGLLRAALADGQPAAPESLLYKHGDPEWFEKAKPAAAVPVAAPAEPLVIRLAESPARAIRGLDRRSPSQLEGGPRVDLARRLRLDAAPSLDRGTLLHAWFQQIEWLDDGRPAEDVLRRIAAAPEFRGLNVDVLLKDFYAALKEPAVRRVLSRSTYEQPPAADAACAIHAAGGGPPWRWQVWRERPFAVSDDDAILSGQIDRLVALYDGSQIVGADILDYKTDALPIGDPGAIDARAAVYRPQLEAYRQAALQLCRLPLERISARLLFVAIGAVRIL